jgi:predicted transcriptional regulator
MVRALPGACVRSGVPHFGDLEAAVMDKVWAAEAPVRVREVLEGVNRDRTPALAYTTVQTVMDVLYRKGWLTRTKEGRANRYAATGTREDYVAGLVGEALAVTEDRAAAMLRFVEGMAPGDVARLRRALDAAKSGRGRAR